ncbi:beta-N-acetylglucosaminidase [Pseudonocardiaceae bacterium YIM PH 21723]|nr:beta-N-acetylglucosaminidase [Pseudonocardiaceae bacterium YIM PH 21723]
MVTLHKALPTLLCAALLGLLVPATGTAATAPPAVTPQPQSISAAVDVPVPDQVRLVVADDVDQSTRQVLTAALKSAGAGTVTVVKPGGAGGGLAVRAGLLSDPDIAAALPGGATPAEGYRLLTDRDTVVLGGQDADGLFYAAQTFRQLVAPKLIRGAKVTDFPLMPLRGSVEGFYGAPWSHADRRDQLAFYGRYKMNTYIYAPKDDPYHREKWREPYPADKLAQLGELVTAAQAAHVRFTFALSPGNTICFSDKSDQQALVRKLQAIYDLGGRAFSIPLDDIDYGKWHCAQDQTAYGAPTIANTGKAQAELVNRVSREFIRTHPGAKPLQMVPTEYWGTKDSAYKQALRGLDTGIEVMWTGEEVVPAKITAAEAKRAQTVWGRKTFVWDNYPVNDFQATAGRLLLAPYDYREAGLADTTTGITLNPMNQASASKVALVGGADFTWNAKAYQADRSLTLAAQELSGNDPAATSALLAFFDTEHLMPIANGSSITKQAPALQRRLDTFRADWKAGNKAKALAELRPYVEQLATASATIRGGSVEPAFLNESKPWLDALALWGRSASRTLDALQAKAAGESPDKLFAEAKADADAAAKIQTIPGTTRPQGPIKLADGVLDVFIADAPKL